MSFHRGNCIPPSSYQISRHIFATWASFLSFSSLAKRLFQIERKQARTTFGACWRTSSQINIIAIHDSPRKRCISAEYRCQNKCKGLEWKKFLGASHNDIWHPSNLPQQSLCRTHKLEDPVGAEIHTASDHARGLHIMRTLCFIIVDAANTSYTSPSGRV